MSTVDERNVDPIQEMSRVGRSFLDFSTWGFRESFRLSKPPTLIHDSEQCRIKLIWGGWDPLGGNSINIRYGRLHAPNEISTMMWNGEECHCWHRFEHALHFLDGRSSTDASKMNFSHPLIAPFYEAEFRQNSTVASRNGWHRCIQQCGSNTASGCLNFLICGDLIYGNNINNS